MLQFGGTNKKSSSDSKRHFTVVIKKGKTKNHSEENGLYISSYPSSAARKVVTKLCASKKSKKVEFHIREITQGSKKKTYGPYVGYLEKLKEPIELKGRVIKYKPVVKLNQKISSKIKLSGGHVNDLEIKIYKTLEYYLRIQGDKDLDIRSLINNKNEYVKWLLPIKIPRSRKNLIDYSNAKFVIVRLKKKGWFSFKKTYIAFYITPENWHSQNEYFYLTLLSSGEEPEGFMQRLLQSKIYKSNIEELVKTIIEAKTNVIQINPDFRELQEYFEKNKDKILMSELFTNTDTNTDTSNRNSSNIIIDYNNILAKLTTKSGQLEKNEQLNFYFKEIITAFRELMDEYNNYDKKSIVLEKFNILRNRIQSTPSQIRYQIGEEIFTELTNFLKRTFYDKSRIWVLEELNISPKLDLRSLPDAVFYPYFD